jgi:hypothetical protein
VDQDIREMLLRAKEHGCTDHARISHDCKDCNMNDWLRRGISYVQYASSVNYGSDSFSICEHESRCTIVFI